MNHLIIHRGPDDDGYFFDEHVNFGFRRLSIIDLEAGHQPLSYENERYWIIFTKSITMWNCEKNCLQRDIHLRLNPIPR